MDELHKNRVPTFSPCQPTRDQDPFSILTATSSHPLIQPLSSHDLGELPLWDTGTRKYSLSVARLPAMTSYTALYYSGSTLAGPEAPA